VLESVALRVIGNIGGPVVLLCKAVAAAASLLHRVEGAISNRVGYRKKPHQRTAPRPCDRR
jgi:hypothetical protein